MKDEPNWDIILLQLIRRKNTIKELDAIIDILYEAKKLADNKKAVIDSDKKVVDTINKSLEILIKEDDD